MLEGVEVSAGDFKILQGVSLALHPGELCGLIGPSGAGKSTLIKVLLGLRKPDSGKASLAGGPVADTPIGYVPQDDALHRSLRVGECLGYAAELRLPGLAAQAREARIDEVLAQVDLSERKDVRIKKLSGGQRKRVSVALELLTQPPVLVLDEPTSGLDPGLEARMMGLFAEVAATGRIVLVATHAMQSLKLCHALCVLVRGRVVYFSRPEEAPAYFGVNSFAGIFEVLNTHAPKVWSAQWLQSPARLDFLRRAPPALSLRPAVPLAEPPRAEAPSGEAPSTPAPDPVQSAAEQLAALKAELAAKRGGP
jgi:ABC-type multidrug transport system ATPase subunit